MGPDAKLAGAELVEYGVLSRSPKVAETALLAIKKIDPAIQKDLEMLVVDRDIPRKAQAVRNLGIMGADAKSALPAIKAYLEFRKSQARGFVDGETLDVLVHCSGDGCGRRVGRTVAKAAD